MYAIIFEVLINKTIITSEKGVKKLINNIIDKILTKFSFRSSIYP